jgi:hypothetical protein
MDNHSQITGDPAGLFRAVNEINSMRRRYDILIREQVDRIRVLPYVDEKKKQYLLEKMQENEQQRAELIKRIKQLEKRKPINEGL